MRLALAFGRPDVDAFLEEMTHEQYVEWLQFAGLEPIGWAATNLATTRLGYLIVQSQSPKRLKEGDFAIVMKGRPRRDPTTEIARWKAYATRTQLWFGGARDGQAN